MEFDRELYGEFDPDKFIEICFAEGTISTLYGLPGDGKTNFAGVIIEMLIARGYTVYTIIHFFSDGRIAIAKEKGALPGGVNYLCKPKEVIVVNTLSELLIGLLTTEKNVVILDESGIFASSSLGTSRRIRILKETAYIIRHFSSSLLLIAQSKNSIVPDLRERLVEIEMRIRKLGRHKNSRRMISIATGVRVMDDITGEESVKFEVAEGDEYVGIPLTRYPIDSKYTPDFDVEDIDIVEARRRLRKYDSLEVRENNQGAEVIRRLRQEAGVEDDEMIDGIQLLTVSEYAKRKRVTTNTVRRWCNTKKIRYTLTEGGHRRIPADQ